MNFRPPASRRTAPLPYHCDTDRLIREVEEVRHRMFAESALWPCAVRLHPLDLRALRTLPMHYAPAIAQDGHDRLLSLVVVEDVHMAPGQAQVERCEAPHDWSHTVCDYLRPPEEPKRFVAPPASDPLPPEVAVVLGRGQPNRRAQSPITPEDGEPAVYRRRRNELHAERGLEPETVRAARWTGDNLDHMKTLVADGEATESSWRGELLVRQAPGGDGHRAKYGQWVVQPSSGSVYVMHDWAIRELYERVGPSPTTPAVPDA